MCNERCSDRNNFYCKPSFITGEFAGNGQYFCIFKHKLKTFLMKCAICMFEHPNRFPIFLAKWYRSFDVTPFKRRDTAVFISVLLFKYNIFFHDTHFIACQYIFESSFKIRHDFFYSIIFFFLIRSLSNLTSSS